MKNIFKFIFIVAALAIVLPSCREDAELAPTGEPVNIAAQCQGQFNGNWTVTKQVGKKDPTTNVYTGSVTLDPQANYVTKLTSSCPDAKIDWTMDMNINQRMDTKGYELSNNNPKNVLGTKVMASVSSNYEMTLTYTAITKEGRNDVTTTAVFVGSK